MVDKKELNQEELEKVSGGTPYLGMSEPTIDSFAYKPGDVFNHRIMDDNYGEYYFINVRCVAVGKRDAGSTGLVKSYNLFYKLQTIDRKISGYDGWYDFTPYLTTVVARKVSSEGITIVAQI